MSIIGNFKRDAKSDSYTGELIHWRNRVTKGSKRYGSVTNSDEPTGTARLIDPNSYHPPVTISFSSISKRDFSAAAFTLHGFSVDVGDALSGGYRSTCELTVLRRLNHMPTDQERNAWRAERPSSKLTTHDSLGHA